MGVVIRVVNGDGCGDRCGDGCGEGSSDGSGDKGVWYGGCGNEGVIGVVLWM